MDKPVLKKELTLDCEHIVGFVGRLVPEKGLTALLAAMRYLPTEVHCLIIGSGPMRAEVELWSGLPDLNGRIHIFDVMPPRKSCQVYELHGRACGAVAHNAILERAIWAGDR